MGRFALFLRRFARAFSKHRATVVAIGMGMNACTGTSAHGDEARDSSVVAPESAVASAENTQRTDSDGTRGRKITMREHRIPHVLVFDAPSSTGVASQARKLDVSTAEASGYTVVDLGNDWVPYIFSEKTPSIDDAKPNTYRQRYMDLANDRTDIDGDPLPPHEHNYLELYGIPPSLAVIFAQWQSSESELEPCLAAAGFDPKVFEGFTDTIAYTGTHNGRKLVRQAKRRRSDLDKLMRKARIAAGEWARAAEHPSTRLAHQRWREAQKPIDIIDHAQRRFRCERLFPSHAGRGKFESGVFDSATTHALAMFEKKHAMMGWGHFKNDNLAVLAKPVAQANHDRLERVLAERVVAAAGILEDGTAARWKPTFRWHDQAGVEQQLRDVVTESVDTFLTALGINTPETARQQLATLSDVSNGFEGLLVGVKLPAAPEYYSDDMQLDVIVDRGDVWYDFPYDAEGRPVSQPRKRYPHVTLYVTYLGQHIPLVHWRTTIGSWRSEQRDGLEWFKYKNSDVGPRVWREIVAAPTWLPPDTATVRELLKRKWMDGKMQTVVKYDEMGPGYRSAYGLVAAYHVKELYDADGAVRTVLDNGIRTHGSVDYMSILRRYSHGCHRLYNMSAVRMFSFVLQHGPYTRTGEERVGFRRIVEHEGAEYRIALDSRGYSYVLERAIPVLVTDGRIKGSRKRPIEDYMPKPGVDYTAPADTPFDPAAVTSPDESASVPVEELTSTPPPM